MCVCVSTGACVRAQDKAQKKWWGNDESRDYFQKNTQQNVKNIGVVVGWGSALRQHRCASPVVRRGKH